MRRSRLDSEGILAEFLQAHDVQPAPQPNGYGEQGYGSRALGGAGGDGAAVAVYDIHPVGGPFWERLNVEGEDVGMVCGIDLLSTSAIGERDYGMVRWRGTTRRRQQAQQAGSGGAHRRM